MDLGTRTFRGIRFATAGRLEAPTDTVGWDDAVQSAPFGPQCPQNGGVLEQLLGGHEIESDEDCHFLNVFTPGCDDARRPVLVWIHGGAFVTGTAAMPWYDGSPLAARGDVVVVTINYRLGALGFLGQRNLGSLDQLSALRWVRRHIADFGGDPDNVTLFGESAGGASVLSLFAAPEAHGLFHAAWAMSPSYLQLRTADEADERADTYLRAFGGDVDQMRTVEVSTILDAQATMARSPDMKDFAPTERAAPFPETFHEAIAGDARPLVIGTTLDEMALFTAFDPRRADWSERDVERQFERRFGSGASAAIDAYRAARPDRSASALVAAMQTDETFRIPAQRVAAARQNPTCQNPTCQNPTCQNPTWMYLFDQRSTAFDGVFGSCHGLDIPFAFGTLDAPGAEMFTGSHPTHTAVADQFTEALTTFARHHCPGWVEYDLDTRPTQRIGADPEVVDDPESELRQLWI